MHLSQGALNLLAVCPRKFQHVYLDQFPVPVSPDEQERLTWGEWFHLLMQRRELNLEINAPSPLGSELEQQLQQCVDRFINAAPELFQPQLSLLRQSEHRRTLYLQRHLLTVVYDLLILEPDRAQIFDWKTYAHPPEPNCLGQNWQTRLYLFVLAETSSYAPEQISMTYWFIQPDTTPQSLQFKYSRALHQNTRRELLDLLAQLDQGLEQYKVGKAFPQVSVSAGTCGSCTFVGRCQPQYLGSPSEGAPDLAGIEEISL